MGREDWRQAIRRTPLSSSNRRGTSSIPPSKSSGGYFLLQKSMQKKTLFVIEKFEIKIMERKFKIYAFHYLIVFVSVLKMI